MQYAGESACRYVGQDARTGLLVACSNRPHSRYVAETSKCGKKVLTDPLLKVSSTIDRDIDPIAERSVVAERQELGIPKSSKCV